MHDGWLVLTQYDRLAGNFDQKISHPLLVLLAHFLITIYIDMRVTFSLVLHFLQRSTAAEIVGQFLLLLEVEISIIHDGDLSRQFYYFLKLPSNQYSILQNRNSKIILKLILSLLMNQSIFHIWPNPNQFQTCQTITVPLQNVDEIGVGEKHVVIRTENRIIGYGDNSKGQLGLEDIQQENDSFVTIWSKFMTNKIVKVACGWNHTLILDEFGEVLSAGEGKFGALGQGRGANSYTFKPVSGLKGIKSISAGKDHSLALSSIKVYGWGSSMDGQLGIPKQKICYQPQELYIYPSLLCFAGCKYSIFVTQKGIYATGQNDMGQLGLGNKLKVKMAKKINGIEEPIVWIGGSSSYSVLQTSEKQFYISGTGCLGQYLYPTKIKQFRNCQQLLLGQDFGLIEDQNNIYYSWDGRKDQAPVPNQFLSSLSLESTVCGSKLLICRASNNSRDLYSRAYSLKPQKHNIYQKNEGMVRSSIEYCLNQQFNSNHPSGNQDYVGNQKRNRKKSEGIQTYNEMKEVWQSKKNRFPTQQQGQPDWGQLYRLQDDDNIHDHEARKKMPEQVGSPYFKKQMLNSRSVQSPRAQEMLSNRTETFDDYESSRIKQPMVLAPDSSISRENQRISEEPSSWCQTSIRKKQSESFRGQLYMESQQCELKNKLSLLETQNRKKDEEIKKLRKQMLQLIEIVESDMCLKNLAQLKNSSQLSRKKKQLEQQVNETPDIFAINLENLRALLNKNIDSLTYAV